MLWYQYDTRFSFCANCSRRLVPVYDGRSKPFSFETDLGQLDSVLAPYEEPIPYGSFVIVGYTTAIYQSSKDKSWTLACNVQWVVVLGIPDE